MQSDPVHESCCLRTYQAATMYKSPMYVLIQHPRIACLHWFLLLAIAVYIFLYAAFFQRAYDKRYPITGDFRVKLKAPQNLTGVAELPYCSQYTGHFPSITRAQCKLYNKADVKHPSDIENHLNIMLFRQHRYCSLCPTKENWQVLDGFFVQDIDSWSVELLHVYFVTYQQQNGQTVTVSGGNRELVGELVRSDRSVVATFTKGRDKIAIKDLLLALKDPISLDNRSDIVDSDLYTNYIDYEFTQHANSTHVGDTFRHQGLMILVNVRYLHEIGGNIRYQYRVERFRRQDYSVTNNFHTEFVSYPNNDTSLNPIITRGATANTEYLSALHIKFFIDGEYHTFEIQSTLVNLAAALSLLVVADIVTEQVMLRCLKYSDQYYQAKHRMTKMEVLHDTGSMAMEKKIEFSDIRPHTVRDETGQRPGFFAVNSNSKKDQHGKEKESANIL